MSQQLGFFRLRRKPWTRLAINHPCLASAHQLEVVSIGNLDHELAFLLTVFLLALFALLAVFSRFVLALINDLLDSFFFVGGIFL